MTSEANEKRTPRAIFLAVRQVASLDEQLRLLDKMCVGQDDLHRQVQEMLVAAKSEQTNPLERLGAIVNATASQSDSPRLDREPQVTIGSYKLREQIGEGGMGVVYVAEQTEPVRRKVALKVIKPGMGSRSVVARFEAERQALALMDHPNIARVFDGGATESGQPYFVMELVQGLSITEYCDEHRLGTRERLELICKVCRAVHHAHQKGVIHRDLKPSNVLVAEIDGAAVPKVIDFGVAKAVGHKLTEQTVYTQFSQMVGTPLYMSPEQAGLGVVDVDTRSDVYSLGVVLYELLTGSTPFDSETLKQAGFDEMRRIIREDEPLKPSAKVSTLKAQALSTVSQRRGSDARRLTDALKGELDWLAMKALDKDRNRRYESVISLAKDVERYLAGEAVEACPPSKVYRFRKFARRYRIALATATAIAAVLVAGAVGTTWQMLRAMSAERVAETATIEVRSEANRARAEAARANEEWRRAEDERQRALMSLKLARRTVDTLFLQVGTQWIADETAPSNFQEGILETAARFYRDLTETQVTNPEDLSDLSLVCSGYQRIGTIQHYLQNHEEAVAARRKAVAFVQQGLAVAPQNPDVCSALAENQYELGQSLVELALYDEAVQAFDESSSVAAELVAHAADPQKYRYWLARADLARASVHTRTGSFAEAIRLARAAKDELQAMSKQADRKQVYWGELTTDVRRADYWLAKALGYANDLTEANALCEKALTSCRRQRNIRHDDARLRTLEIDFLELSAELAGLRGDLSAAAEQYHSVLDMRRASLRAGLAPDVFFMKATFAGTIKLDGLIEPGPFCGYVETQLRLAEVLRRAGRPYSAENILGECLNVTVPVVAQRPNALRYRVADVNSWVLAAELLTERRPADAKTAYCRARQLWTETIRQFPNAKQFVSGVHGRQTDWERFQEVGHLLRDFPDPESEDKQVKTDETVFHQHSWSGVGWARAGLWKNAINCFERSAALRSQIPDHDHAYDWLQLAMAHAELGEHDQARTWLDKAEESIGHRSEPHVELIELRAETRSVVEKHRIGSEPCESQRNNIPHACP